MTKKKVSNEAPNPALRKGAVSSSKPAWWKPAIEGVSGDCLCCPATVDKLPLNTRMYNGFGGWVIIKDGKQFYRGDSNLEFEEYPTLLKFEKLAKKEPDVEWLADLNLPLRSGTYQRHGDNTWVLIEKGDGFA